MNASHRAQRVRIQVVGGCTPPCDDCDSCGQPAQLRIEEVERRGGDATTWVLGGGDATRWVHLDAWLAGLPQRDPRPEVWLEAPAAKADPQRFVQWSGLGVRGLVLRLTEASQAAVVAAAEAAGLATQIQLDLRPANTDALVAWVQTRGRTEPIDITVCGVAAARVEVLLRAVPQLRFCGTRRSDRGLLPPCALPAVWDSSPHVWRSVLQPQPRANASLAACAACVLRETCSFRDLAALDDPDAVSAICGDPTPWQRRPAPASDVPVRIVMQRPARPLLCTSPWTAMEVVDPRGLVTQCCADWTVGSRGDLGMASLRDIWNGEGYQRARRVMASTDPGPLCRPACPRLGDGLLAERALRIQSGSRAFVENQLLLAEDIAQRREVVRALPLQLALCPSTYCNYDCIMCVYGRTPRRDLPSQVWDELPSLLPTLKSLTLLGGEPLAQPRVMQLLRSLDVATYPDLSVDLVTNGALLTAAALRHLARATFGHVTISLNAGTEAAYRAVQRGDSLAQVLANLDALLALRAQHHRWFGVTLSFVAQPAAIDTLQAFASIAQQRNLPIRILALNTDQVPELDFYEDPAAVGHVAAVLEAFAASSPRPDWAVQARSARTAVLRQAAARMQPVERP